MTRWIKATACGILIACNAGVVLAQAPATTQAAIIEDSSTPQGTLLMLLHAQQKSDADVLKKVFHASTPREEKMLGPVIEGAAASAKLRAATAKAFGEDAAAKLISSAGGDAAEADLRRAVVTITGDKATVQFADSPSSIPMVKVDGAWKVPIAAIMQDATDDQLETAAEQSHQAAAAVSAVADEVSQGKYKTPEEMQTAIMARLQAIANAGPATAPSPAPAP